MIVGNTRNKQGEVFRIRDKSNLHHAERSAAAALPLADFCLLRTCVIASQHHSLRLLLLVPPLSYHSSTVSGLAWDYHCRDRIAFQRWPHQFTTHATFEPY
jgi:hypothetical protein